MKNRIIVTILCALACFSGMLQGNLDQCTIEELESCYSIDDVPTLLRERGIKYVRHHTLCNIELSTGGCAWLSAPTKEAADYYVAYKGALQSIAEHYLSHVEAIENYCNEKGMTHKLEEIEAIRNSIENLCKNYIGQCSFNEHRRKSTDEISEGLTNYQTAVGNIYKMLRFLCWELEQAGHQPNSGAPAYRLRTLLSSFF